MATYTSSVTPRLRVARNSPLNYDRSSQIASASESGPSRLPEFSQLVDLNLNDMAMSEASDQLSTSTIPAPSTSTRSENPAAVLRALLSRLPAQSKSPTPSQSPSQQYLSERESDYDMDISERGNATPSMAQESLKDIFSKARRDPGDTPQKMRPRRNSVDTSEVDASPRVEKQRADHKGKRRSLSDDEMDNANRLSQRRATRFKPSPQPITMEFLRERFSDSRVSHGSVEDEGPLSIHNSSNDTATILRDLKSLQSTPPAATSTPQQSLRLSVNSQFQSNLLDQDTEMQNAIDELDSYGERSAERSISPPPILRKRPTSRTENPSPLPSNPIHDSGKTPTANHAVHRHSFPSMASIHVSSNEHEKDELLELNGNQEHEWNKPRNSRDSSHLHRSRLTSLDEPTPRHDETGTSSHHLQRRSSINKLEESDRLVTSRKSHKSLEFTYSNVSRLPSTSHTNLHRHHSFSSSRTSSPSASSVASRDNGHADIVRERERNWNSPHPSWHKPPASRPLTSPSPSVSPSPQHTDSRLRSKSFQSANQSKGQSSSRRAISPANSPNSGRVTENREIRRSLSPVPAELPSPTPSRSSSLQAIDNTYRHRDPSLRRLSFPKKESTSPNVSSASRRSKVSASLSRKQPVSPSFNEAKEVSSGSISRSTPVLNGKSSSSPQANPSTQPSSSWTSATMDRPPSRLQATGQDTDEMRETDLSSQDETPNMRTVSQPDIPDEDEYRRRSTTPLSEPSSRFSIPSNAPRILVEDHTLPRESFEEVVLSPATPPQRSTPKGSRREPKTPSPPKSLPELPTPSSSDESDREPLSQTATPRLEPNGLPDPSWMPTPRPPGGWLQTPMAPRPSPFDRDPYDHSTMQTDDTKSDDEAPLDPKTPVKMPHPSENQFATKTPKPPGAWQTPAPASSSAPQPWSADEQTPEQSEGLLTPIASLSKGSSLDPKTPYVPGGWAATPAARKSILKVRFNPEAEAPSTENGLAPSPQLVDSSFKSKDESRTEDESRAEDKSSVRPPSPRSPRRAKTSNIRILDAFGREQEPSSSGPNDTIRSRNVLRVVDAMGRKVQESEQSNAEESKDEEEFPPSSRGELLSRIRQDLENLVEDIDDIDRDNKFDSIDHARIEELNAVSMQARKNRERLLDQNARSHVKFNLLQGDSAISDSFDSKSLPTRVSRRIYVVFLLVQLLLVLLMYRMSVIRAKELLLNSYYDPFNPELHLYIFKYDNSFHFMDADISGEALLQGGGNVWDNWLRFMGDIQSYFWKLLADDVGQQNTAWSPT